MFWYISLRDELKSEIVQDIDLTKSNSIHQNEHGGLITKSHGSKGRMDPQSEIGKLHCWITFATSDYEQNVQQRLMSQMDMIKPENLKEMAFIFSILLEP